MTGVSTPTTSVSWKPFLPVMLLATCPVIATTGEESAKAVAIPVTRLVAPGPDVARADPGLPRDPAVGVRHVGAELFVSDEHVLDLRVPERIVEG